MCKCLPMISAKRGLLSGTASESSLLDHRPQHNVAIFDAGVVPLQVNRTGPAHIRPKRAPGTALDGLIVDDLFAIEDDCGMALHEGNVKSLPLPGWFTGLLGRGDARVNPADVVGTGGLPLIVGHFHFINSAH